MDTHSPLASAAAVRVVAAERGQTNVRHSRNLSPLAWCWIWNSSVIGSEVARGLDWKIGELIRQRLMYCHGAWLISRLNTHTHAHYSALDLQHCFLRPLRGLVVSETILRTWVSKWSSCFKCPWARHWSTSQHQSCCCVANPDLSPSCGGRRGASKRISPQGEKTFSLSLVEWVDGIKCDRENIWSRVYFQNCLQY